MIRRWLQLSFISSVSIIFASSLRAADLDASLIGRWRGHITISTQKLPVQFDFAPNGTVLVVDGESKTGTFVTAAERITVSLATGDEKVAVHILVTGLTAERLSGKFSIEGEPAELAGTIELDRSDAPLSSPGSRESENRCSVADLPQELKSVLAHFGVACPIPVQSPVSPPEAAYLSKVFRGVLNEVLGPDFSIVYAGGGKFVIRGTHSSMPEVEQALKPLLADPDAVTLTAYEPPCPPGLRCALEIAGYSQIKPEFRKGNSIDFVKIWNAAVNVSLLAKLNLVPPAKTPPFQASTGLDPKTVGPNGIIFERISLSIEDAHPEDKGEKGKYVQFM